MRQFMQPDYARHWGNEEPTYEQVLQWAVRNWGDRTGNPFRQDVDQAAELWLRFENDILQFRRNNAQRLLDLPDVPVVKWPCKRRLEQPTLKLKFETLHDAKMRLAGGMIFIGSVLYYVRDVHELENDYLLILEDSKSKRYKSWYNKTTYIDLRSPEPQYITSKQGTGFLMRHPYRQNRQSLHVDLLRVKQVGDDNYIRPSSAEVMDGIVQDVFQWNPSMADILLKIKAIPSLRMSKYIAVYRDAKPRVCVEYKGRFLGKIEDDIVFTSDADAQRPWIREAVAQIGCDVRAK